MLSFWEKNSFTSYDVIVVGGGIVGLSTAAALLERDPNKRVLVLERSILPTGASTRNAGFACVGSVHELVDDLQSMSKEAVQVLVEERYRGLLQLRERLGDSNIGYLPCGGFELLFEGEEKYLEELAGLNELLKPIFEKSIYSNADEKIGAFGFYEKRVHHLLLNSAEGQIDTGKMMHSLLTYVQEKGAVVLGGAEVKEWKVSDGKVSIEIAEKSNSARWKFEAEKLAVCTNGFSRQFFPEIDLKPGRGQVLITKPIDNLPFEGVFHYDSGYYYFRNYGKRIIIGGGRNLDFAAEETTEMANTEIVLNKLKSELSDLIIPNLAFEIEHQWAGIMAFGNDKNPILKKVNDQVFLGMRLGGMGVAIGSRLGDRMAEMILD